MTDVETDAQVVREALELMFDIDEEERAAGFAALDRIQAELAQVREKLEKRTGDFNKWSWEAVESAKDDANERHRLRAELAQVLEERDFLNDKVVPKMEAELAQVKAERDLLKVKVVIADASIAVLAALDRGTNNDNDHDHL